MKIVFLIFFLLFFSCSAIDEPLNKEERKLVDSLYRSHLVAINDSLDSLCLEKYENLLQHYIDSIREVRLTEINELLDVEKK